MTGTDPPMEDLDKALRDNLREQKLSFQRQQTLLAELRPDAKPSEVVDRKTKPKDVEITQLRARLAEVEDQNGRRARALQRAQNETSQSGGMEKNLRRQIEVLQRQQRESEVASHARIRELETQNLNLEKQMGEIEEVRVLQEEYSAQVLVRLAQRERSLTQVQEDLYKLQMRFKDVEQREHSLEDVEEELYRTTQVRFEQADQPFEVKGMLALKGETSWHKQESEKWQRQVDSMRRDADKIHELVCQIGS
jgi:hypothetical protein